MARRKNYKAKPSATQFQLENPEYYHEKKFALSDVTKAAEYMRGVLLKLKVDKSVSEIEHELDQVVSYINTKDIGDDRRGFGNCRCYHPPSMGFCIFGLCISGGLRPPELTIKANF